MFKLLKKYFTIKKINNVKRRCNSAIDYILSDIAIIRYKAVDLTKYWSVSIEKFSLISSLFIFNNKITYFKTIVSDEICSIFL